MKYHCPNCGPVNDLASGFPDIPHLLTRIWPGEPVPEGECAQCGALVHKPDPEPVAAGLCPAPASASLPVPATVQLLLHTHRHGVSTYLFRQPITEDDAIAYLGDNYEPDREESVEIISFNAFADGGTVSVPSCVPSPLAAFGDRVLHLLTDPDWNADLLNEVAKCAENLGLSDSDEHGTFRRLPTPSPISETRSTNPLAAFADRALIHYPLPIYQPAFQSTINSHSIH